MEKQSQSSLSLLALLPDGKVENDVRITDKAVTGICTVYAKRADKENEFWLREIGVVALDGNCNLTDAVRIAKSEACDAAIGHISGRAPAAEQQQPQLSVVKTQEPGAKPIPGPKPELELETPAPDPAGKDADPPPKNSADTSEADEPAPDTGTETRPPVDLRSIVDTPETEANPAAQADTPLTSGDGKADNPVENGGIERIEFGASLFPASDLAGSYIANSVIFVTASHTQLPMFLTLRLRVKISVLWQSGNTPLLGEPPDKLPDAQVHILLKSEVL